MHNQMAPFGMYGFGLGQTGWPQYPMTPIGPHLLQGYQQDPYGIAARQIWAQAQVTNPWAVQALLGEIVGSIARQQQMGFGQIGMGAPLPFAAGFGPHPFAAFGPQLPLTMGAMGQLPFGAGLGHLQQPQWATPFGQAGYGIGAGLGNGVGGVGLGSTLPYPTAAGAWAPTMAMV